MERMKARCRSEEKTIPMVGESALCVNYMNREIALPHKSRNTLTNLSWTTE